MTLFDGRLALAHQVVDEVRSRFADLLLTPLIPRNVRLSEAPSHGLPISLYDPTCRGAVAYAEASPPTSTCDSAATSRWDTSRRWLELHLDVAAARTGPRRRGLGRGLDALLGPVSEIIVDRRIGRAEPRRCCPARA